MNEFLAMVKDGTRDLTSKALRPFYVNAPPVSSEEVASRKSDSDVYRSLNSLDPIGGDSFSFQIGEGNSRSLFISFLRQMGIEAVYAEDVYSEKTDPVLLSLSSLSRTIAALSAQGIEPDTESIREKFEDLGIPFESEEVLHVSDPLPDSYGEEDTIIAEKLRRARVYVETYFAEES